MTIYITKENEEFLRKHSGSMGGLINILIDSYRLGDKNALNHQKFSKGIPVLPGQSALPLPEKLRGGAGVTAVPSIIAENDDSKIVWSSDDMGAYGDLKNKPRVKSEKRFDFCKHDSVKGMCKQGC